MKIKMNFAKIRSDGSYRRRHPGGLWSGSYHGSTTPSIPPTAVPPTAVPPTAVPPTAVPPTAVPPPQRLHLIRCIIQTNRLQLYLQE